MTDKTVDSMNRVILDYKDKNTGEVFHLPYRVYYPTGYEESDRKYSLLFFLHGHGECGTENELQIRVLHKENALLDRVLAHDDCIIVAPQCPCDPPQHEWVALNHAWGTGSREVLDEKPTVAMSAAIELLDSFLVLDKVDKKRIYAAGISMGGYAAWEIITRLPHVFAAAIPVCGAGFPRYADSLKHIAIWAFHGAADPTVPSAGTHDMENALRSVGGNIRATYYSGVGHDSWIPAYREPELTDWLFAQSK